MSRSVLDDLGEEVTGIVAPVSACMALTLALVRVLNPDGDSDSHSVFLASAYYVEAEGDSAGTKLGGALVNSLIFVSVVAAMTFALVLLFKHGYVRVIYAYMCFAGFSIFFVLTGLIALQLLQRWRLHADLLTFTYVLFNFAAVGSLTLFFFPAPLLLKQCYLIVTGVVTAYVFTWIPPWTTWALLVAMAAYDLAAVLVPGGPLKMLVELAQEREETLPALVYEARAVRRPPPGAAAAAPPPPPLEARGGGGGGGGVAQGGALMQQELPRRPSPPPPPSPLAQLLPPRGADEEAASAAEVAAAEEGGAEAADADDDASDTQALLGPRHAQPGGVAAGSSAAGAPPGAAAGSAGQAWHHHRRQPSGSAGSETDEGSDAFLLPDGIKLGLGDFIFYSLCLSRAAFAGWAAAAATYLAILAGLGCTLLWLAVAHRALPALPVSIALAALCFALTRLLLEPLLLPASLALAFF